MASDSLISVLLHNWPLVLPILFITYLLTNYFNHGLNKYPGPFFASLTDWWRFWIVYKRRPELSHIKLHAKHGPVVRLGPNNLSFSDPKALKAIYGLNKGFTKSEFYPVQMAIAKGRRLPSLFSTTSESFHANLRRCVNSAFSMSTLIQYEPFVDSTTVLFLSQTEKIYAAKGEPCNFSRWLQFYAFDVIGEMTYSKRHGFLEENKDIDGIVGYISSLFDYVAPIGQIPILDLFYLKNPLYLLLSKYGLLDSTFAVAKFAQARMAERFPPSSKSTPATTILPSTEPPKSNTATQPPDLLSKFMQARIDRPEFMSDSMVMTMAVSMAFAGSETTAISLSSVFYYLLKNEKCMKKLYEELDGKAMEGYFKDNEEGIVTWTESQGLDYLDACIKESFRLHPAPGLPLERVVPPQGAEIAGEFVKGGTIVGCSAWVIHRNQEIFGEDVEAFRPERWLVGQGDGKELGEEEKEVEEKRVRRMEGTMLQFGMGARTCIGKNISLLEIYKLVPSFLRRFEVRLQDPTKEWTVHNAWFVRQLNFDTTFHRRELVQPTKTSLV